MKHANSGYFQISIRDSNFQLLASLLKGDNTGLYSRHLVRLYVRNMLHQTGSGFHPMDQAFDPPMFRVHLRCRSGKLNGPSPGAEGKEVFEEVQI